MQERDLRRRLLALPDLVNADEALVRRGALCNAVVLLAIDDAVFHMTVAKGRILSLEEGPRLMRSWDFAVRATAEAWSRFWRPVPEPGWHDLFALMKRGEANVEGDLTPFMTHLQYFKDVLAAPRMRMERAA